MLKKLLIGIGALLALALIFVFGVLYKSDLTRDQLARYISDESEFMDLPNGANMHYRDEGNPKGPVSGDGAWWFRIAPELGCVG